MKTIIFDFIMITLFPQFDVATIKVCKRGFTKENGFFEIETERTIDFLSGIHYLNKYELKMKLDKKYGTNNCTMFSVIKRIK